MNTDEKRKSIHELEESLCESPQVGKKPLLHSSMLGMFLRCGEQFYQRYMRGIISPSSIALLIGSTSHTVQEKELIHKLDNDGSLMPLEQAQAIAEEAFKRHKEERGLKLLPAEREMGLKSVVGKAIDQSIVLAELFHNNYAPVLKPQIHDHVEWPWIVEFEGYPFDLAGTSDLLEVADDRLDDLKTSKQTPNQRSVDTSDQYCLYDLAYRSVIGREPTIVQNTLVKLKTPKITTIETRHTQGQLDRFINRLETFAVAYEKGVFLPASNQGWWCGPNFCDYSETCRYFLGKRTFNVPEQIGRV